jgi:hypothetical protein
MKKNKTGWKFTDKEKEHFDLVLKGTGKNQKETEQFISRLEIVCDQIKICLDFPKRDKVRDNREDALSAFKGAMSATKEILLGRKVLSDFTGMMDMGDGHG